MYIAENVGRSQGSQSAGAAAPKEPNVTVVAVDDILSFPKTDGKGVNMVGSFVMKPGAKMIQVYMTSSKSKASYEPQGEEDAESYKHKFEGEHPGNSLEIAEFIQNWTGVPAIVIYGSCADNFRKVVGTKCAPVRLKATLQDDNDARKNMLVFEQSANTGYVLGHYTGNLILAEPFAVVSAAGFALSPANGLNYKLPVNNSATPVAFSSVTLVDGDSVTLIGSGGNNPSVLEAGANGGVTVLLKDGTDWVALVNAVIHFKVYDAGATTYLIEQSRG